MVECGIEKYKNQKNLCPLLLWFVNISLISKYAKSRPEGNNVLLSGNIGKGSSIYPWVYAGENVFSSSPSKSFPLCTSTDGCKGVGYGFNVGALFYGCRLWFQCRRVVLVVGANTGYVCEIIKRSKGISEGYHP